MSERIAPLIQPLNADDLVSSIKHLPPLPNVAREILDRLGDEFIEGNEIADIVSRDPAISGRLIALANSAYFGLANPVADMRDVVNRVLGPDTVRSLAFVLASKRTLNYSACERFDARRFWYRALGSAIAAKRIAPVVEGLTAAEQEFAYVTGLCHSLGLLALAFCHPAETSAALEAHADGQFGTLDVIAAAQFGRSVSAVTHALAAHWQMPHVIVDAYACRASAQPNQDLFAATINAAVKSARHTEEIANSGTALEQEILGLKEELPDVDDATLARVAVASEKEQQAAQTTLSAMIGNAAP